MVISISTYFRHDVTFIYFLQKCAIRLLSLVDSSQRKNKIYSIRDLSFLEKKNVIPSSTIRSFLHRYYFYYNSKLSNNFSYYRQLYENDCVICNKSENAKENVFLDILISPVVFFKEDRRLMAQ